jgi:hypothetical protein
MIGKHARDPVLTRVNQLLLRGIPSLLLCYLFLDRENLNHDIISIDL